MERIRALPLQGTCTRSNKHPTALQLAPLLLLVALGWRAPVESMRLQIGIAVQQQEAPTQEMPAAAAEEVPVALDGDAVIQDSRLQARADSVRRAKELAAEDGLVLWTLGNNSWRDFVLNWVTTVMQAGVEHFFVAALDDELLAELESRGLPCVSLHSRLGSADYAWGTDIFKERGREKIRFIQAMLMAGLQPMFSDLDVVWLRNPLPWVRQFAEPNVLMSSDSWDAHPEEDQLDNCCAVMGTDRDVVAVETFVGKMNVGIHVFRPSALPIVEAWSEEMASSGQMEQLCWNNVLLKTMELSNSSDSWPADTLCRAMGGRIAAGLLPASMFENGHTFFVQRLPERLRVQPFAVHASYIAGRFSKIHHLREALQWHVDPQERFSSEHKLLTLDLDLPPELLQRSGPPADLGDRDLSLDDVAGHLDLVRHQYIQIKAATALAKVLGRSLVMPQLWCGLENLWAPHQGRVWGGVQYPSPFECPMSQLYHIEEWGSIAASEQQLLPPVLESSFLSNPRTRLEHGQVVHISSCTSFGMVFGQCCRGGESWCHPKQDALKMMPGLPKGEVLRILQGVAHARVLKLSNVAELWPRGSVGEMGAFDAAYDMVRRGWCCTDKIEAPLVDLAWPTRR